MSDKHIKPTKDNSKGTNKTRETREFSGVYMSSHIKIFDPNTNEVLVKKRADD